MQTCRRADTDMQTCNMQTCRRADTDMQTCNMQTCEMRARDLARASQPARDAVIERVTLGGRPGNHS